MTHSRETPPASTAKTKTWRLHCKLSVPLSNIHTHPANPTTHTDTHMHTDIWAESFSTKLHWSSNTKFNLAQFWLFVHAFVGVALLSHDITNTTALGPSSKEKLALTNDLKPALPSTQYLSLWKEDKGRWGEGESAVPALLCCADWDKTNRFHCTEGSQHFILCWRNPGCSILTITTPYQTGVSRVVW